MIAISVIIVVVLLILILPLGVRVKYAELLYLKLQIGPLGIQVFPRKHDNSQKKSQNKKEKVKKPPDQKKFRLTLQDVFELLHIVFRALHRVRKYLSIDLLRLHLTMAADDPYDAVVHYGAVNAALSTLLPLAECVMKIRERDIETSVDLESSKSQVMAEFAASLQVWEILVIAVCAIISLLSWYMNKRKLDRNADERIEEKG